MAMDTQDSTPSPVLHSNRSTPGPNTPINVSSASPNSITNMGPPQATPTLQNHEQQQAGFLQFQPQPMQISPGRPMVDNGSTTAAVTVVSSVSTGGEIASSGSGVVTSYSVPPHGLVAMHPGGGTYAAAPPGHAGMLVGVRAPPPGTGMMVQQQQPPPHMAMVPQGAAVAGGPPQQMPPHHGQMVVMSAAAARGGGPPMPGGPLPVAGVAGPGGIVGLRMAPHSQQMSPQQHQQLAAAAAAAAAHHRMPYPPQHAVSAGMPLPPQHMPRPPMPPTSQMMQQTAAAAGAAATGGNPAGGRLPTPLNVNARMLDGRRISTLAKEVDPYLQLDDDVIEALAQIADNFIDTVTINSCKFAKHRNSTKLEEKDIQLYLEEELGMFIPGFGNDEIRPHKKPQSTDAHRQRLALMRRVMKK